jgi:cyclase
MLKMRVIISLLLNDGEISRTKRFVPDYTYTPEFVTVDSIDELFIIDITRGETRRERFARYVKKLVDNCFVPLCVGGHIRTLEDVKWAMGEFGADSVLVNAEAHRNERFIPEVAQKLGSQAITAGLDVSNKQSFYDQGTMKTVIFSPGPKQHVITPDERARELKEQGAGQIFLQSIDRDGSLEGYDLEICRQVADAVSIPIVIGGGCGNWTHIKEAIEIGHATGCATSNIFHFTETTISSWKQKLHEAGVPVRVE